MERTIDRASYRRSARQKEQVNERALQEVDKKPRYKLLYIFLDQIIVSLLIILELLTTQYFEIDGWKTWLAHNMSSGDTMKEVVKKIEHYFLNEEGTPLVAIMSGEEKKEVKELSRRNLRKWRVPFCG